MSKNLIAASMAVTGVVIAWSGCSSTGSGGAGGGSTKSSSSSVAAASSSGAATSSSSGGSGGTGGGSTSSSSSGTTTTSSSSSTTASSSTSGTTTSSSSSGTSSSSSGGPDAGGDIQCNPVTNAGCTDPGATCDLEYDATGTTIIGFTCYPGPNTVAVCGDCSSDTCAPGSTCMVAAASICARYCCSNADCGTGTCQTGDFPPLTQGIGVCVTAVDAGGNPYQCTVPATAPSGGSCI